MNSSTFRSNQIEIFAMGAHYKGVESIDLISYADDPEKRLIDGLEDGEQGAVYLVIDVVYRDVIGCWRVTDKLVLTPIEPDVTLLGEVEDRLDARV